MMTRRLATAPPPEPTVKFYKTIALSFLALTVVLLVGVVYLSSKKALITIVAKQDSRTVDATLHLGPGGNPDTTIPGSVTSTVFSWSKKYFPVQTTAVEAVATGEVIIFNKGSSDQPLVATTRLLTTGGVLVRLKDKVVVPANGQLTAAVYADQAGAVGDIAPSAFTIPGLNEEKQKIVYAQSQAPFSGGMRQVSALTAADLSAAEADFRQQIKEAFVSTLPPTEPTERLAVAVGTVTGQADHELGAQLSDFNFQGSATMVVVRYDKARLATVLSAELAKKFDASAEKVALLSKEPVVSVASYNLAAGTAELAASEEAMATLDPDGAKLAASQFFGKRKSDIERYLLSLDHVAGVDVKFSPSWMLSAPSVSDKIKIVVKTVQ